MILLDAAYTPAVLPGSHIDIYVNDSIASTVPITSSGGGLPRHLPINVTMRHFRPGVNTIAIEAILETESDKVSRAWGNRHGCPALCAVRYVRIPHAGLCPGRPIAQPRSDGGNRGALQPQR